MIDADVTAANDAEAGQAAGLLRSLIARLGVRGDYAIREEEGLVHLAIETDYDRDRLRTQLGAESLPAPIGWASYAGFRFSSEKWEGSLASSEPPPEPPGV